MYDSPLCLVVALTVAIATAIAIAPRVPAAVHGRAVVAVAILGAAILPVVLRVTQQRDKKQRVGRFCQVVRAVDMPALTCTPTQVHQLFFILWP